MVPEYFNTGAYRVVVTGCTFTAMASSVTWAACEPPPQDVSATAIAVTNKKVRGKNMRFILNEFIVDEFIMCVPVVLFVKFLILGFFDFTQGSDQMKSQNPYISKSEIKRCRNPFQFGSAGQYSQLRQRIIELGVG
jgi:hypothetical protein